ncbi:hypothetical protein GCM10023193_59330 [Planotetraspora kaengkrachanensis]|jgi:hypothetical protein|uniref:Uncharacterized protein n=1 Tax=Planotetraspora kaengkrachanensis TaxID=575193 RepID=A0A8J3PVX1_9ACTN|nr:hypothetical protein Pka01_51790 [Planotetraspora kaengkrachanensis]
MHGKAEHGGKWIDVRPEGVVDAGPPKSGAPASTTAAGTLMPVFRSNRHRTRL